MDAVGHMRSAAHRIEAARDLLADAYKDLDAAAEMAAHALDHWTGELRTPPESVLPSQLPDRTLGPALAKVRDFLRPAPGRPVGPLFDEVVAEVGLSQARERADDLASAGHSPDLVWLRLVEMTLKPGRRPDGERME